MITYGYDAEGSKVIYEKTGDKLSYYTYDENGQIIGMMYDYNMYYYIKNAQNDIVGILDSSLNQVVSYEYDSWGKIISIKDANGNNITSNTHIGKINPYRYRSYRYEEETGLYYLNSRYYNPEWGRFINADSYMQTPTGSILASNMYIYCENNPVNLYDPNGYFWFSVIVNISKVVVDVVKTIKGNIKTIDTNSSPPSESGYKAPKSKGPIQKQLAPGSKDNEKGWPDKKGDIWVPDTKMHGGEGWRVHSPDGTHRHVYPNGRTRTHNYDSHECWDLKEKQYLTTDIYNNNMINYSDNYYYFLPMPGAMPVFPSFYPSLVPGFIV